MNRVQSTGGRHVNFVRDPLISYFDEWQKNENRILYLYYFENEVILEFNNCFRRFTGY